MIKAKTLIFLAVLALTLGACTPRAEKTWVGGAGSETDGAFLGRLGGDAAFGAAVGGIIDTDAGFLACHRTDQSGRCW